MLKHQSMILSKQDNIKFENIYNTHKKNMFYVANRIAKDQYLSEDIVQQSFLRIINNLDKINDVNCHKTKGFIVMVVQNISIDFYRKHKIENNISFDEIETYIENIEQKDILITNDLEETISNLPIIYSNILRLRFIYGYSYIDIAKILKTSETNVRQRVSRSKKKLKEFLDRAHNIED